MIWLLFAILGPVLWGLSNVMDSALRRKFVQNDIALTWMAAASRFPFIILCLVLSGFKMPAPGAIALMILGGLFWTLPLLFYYRALDYEDPTRVALLGQSTPIFTLLIAFFALREQLVLNQGIAFVFLIAGGIFATLKKIKGAWKLSPAFLLILISTLIWACSDVLFKKLEPSFNGFFSAFGFYLLGSFLTSLVVIAMPGGRKKILPLFHHLPARAWRMIGVTQTASIAGSFAFAYALTLGKASLTSVMLGIQPLAAFLIGLGLAPLLKEISREDVSKRALLMKALSFAMVIIGLVALQK